MEVLKQCSHYCSVAASLRRHGQMCRCGQLMRISRRGLSCEDGAAAAAGFPEMAAKPLGGRNPDGTSFRDHRRETFGEYAPMKGYSWM